MNVKAHPLLQTSVDELEAAMLQEINGLQERKNKVRNDIRVVQKN